MDSGKVYFIFCKQHRNEIFWFLKYLKLKSHFLKSPRGPPTYIFVSGPLSPLAPYTPKKGVAPNWKIFLSMRRMHTIRCALELCDPGGPFEYLKHVCDVKTFFSRLVWSSKIPWKVTRLSEISKSMFEWKIWLFKEFLNFKSI